MQITYQSSKTYQVTQKTGPKLTVFLWPNRLFRSFPFFKCLAGLEGPPKQLELYHEGEEVVHHNAMVLTKLGELVLPKVLGCLGFSMRNPGMFRGDPLGIFGLKKAVLQCLASSLRGFSCMLGFA